MTHSMPCKALWESGFAFLRSWLGDFWSAPAKLRGFFTLMKSLELVVQHTGMHSLTAFDPHASLLHVYQPLQRPQPKLCSRRAL